jgi:dihydroorotate dehydrogenase electron transfer subunit
VSGTSPERPPQESPRGQHAVQVTAELIATHRVGAYHHLTFVAPGVAELARPGQFVALAVGGDPSANLLRRCFSLHNASSIHRASSIHEVASTDRSSATEKVSAMDKVGRSGTNGGTVEIVVAARGPGTRWLTRLSAHHEVNIVGPLGGAFPLPKRPVAAVLVGGGYGSAPLSWLALALKERGCHVEMVLGAATEDLLFGVAGAREAADGVTVTTDDGSMGVKGWVSDVLPDVIRRSQAEVVYGCGPMAMLKSITGVATAEGAVAHVAVEESMACGVGICMTCVMPVIGNDGLTRMVRSCVEGPIFRGDQVRWDAFDKGWCRVPEDAHGAAAMGGH